MSERPTPETDAEVTTFTSISKLKRRFECSTGKVSAEFARRMERERDEALSDLEFRRGLYKVLEEANNRLIAANEEAVELARTLKQERDEARERLHKALKVLDDYDQAIKNPSSPFWEAFKKWFTWEAGK